MTIFSLVFFKVLSSLLSVVIGFLSGKFAKVQKNSVAALLFYFIAPIVFFSIPASAEIDISSLGITALTFTLCTILGCFSYWLYGKIWQDAHRNILALSAGTGNSGYVVLPIATAIFNDHILSIYAFGLIGISIYEVSVGCYFCACNIGNFRDTMRSVIRIPILNAFFLGFAFSMAGFHIPIFLHDFIDNMKGAFSILGMLTIGLALSDIKVFRLDIKFTSAAFASKFLFYPILFNIFIMIDRAFLQWYNINYYNALQLLCIAPMATNTIVLALLYKIYPEKVATAVLLSLLFVLIYMPVMTSIFLHDIDLRSALHFC